MNVPHCTFTNHVHFERILISLLYIQCVPFWRISFRVDRLKSIVLYFVWIDVPTKWWIFPNALNFTSLRSICIHLVTCKLCILCDGSDVQPMNNGIYFELHTRTSHQNNGKEWMTSTTKYKEEMIFRLLKQHNKTGISNDIPKENLILYGFSKFNWT